MRHKRPTLPTEFYEFVTYKIRFQTAYAVSAYAFHIVKSAHEVDKSLTGGLAEVTDVHSRQHNLLT
ncbi:hypothetical protein ABTK14_23610, partial [Acinetobacter baumannii]